MHGSVFNMCTINGVLFCEENVFNFVLDDSYNYDCIIIISVITVDGILFGSFYYKDMENNNKHIFDGCFRVFSSCIIPPSSCGLITE